MQKTIAALFASVLVVLVLLLLGVRLIFSSKTELPLPTVASTSVVTTPTSSSQIGPTPTLISTETETATNGVQLDNLTIEEKVGQLFMVHFNGTAVDHVLQQLITECHVGGIILFGPNLENANQVRSLVDRAQALAKSNGAGIPLFVAVDQEGWPIARLDGIVTTFPSNMAIAATGDAENAKMVGLATGTELSSLGINMNLAPVLDVNTNPDNPIIGLRSFSSDPTLVADFGVAMIEGFKEAGILATGKHFPGHGDTYEDSHLTLPRVDKSLNDLQATELAPFKAAIEANIDVIMSAHLIVPDITDSRPATLSPAALTSVLQEQMGFVGLIATDSLGMNAITQNFGHNEAALNALMAGADLLMYGNDPGQAPELQLGVCRYMRQQAQLNEQVLRKIDESVAKTLAYKSDVGLFNMQELPSIIDVQTRPHQNLALQIAGDSITVLKDERSIVPLSVEDSTLVIHPNVISSFEATTADMSPNVRILVVELSPSSQQITQAVSQASAVKQVVVVTVNARQYEQQVRLVRELEQYQPVVIAMGLPYDILAFPSVPTYLVSYGYADVSQQAVLEVLFGERQAFGQLPVSIGQAFPVGFGQGP